MRERYGFLVVFWTILTSLVLFAPQPVYAQLDNTPAGAAANPAVQGTLPVDTALCPGEANGTNTLDNAARAATNAQAQSVFNNIMAMATMFPMLPSMSACLQAVQKIMTAIPGLADPGGFGAAIGALIGGLVAGLIGSICSQVMSQVTAIQDELTNMAKICIPLPNFGGMINLPLFNLPAGCSGGMQIPLINGWMQQSLPAQYNYNQYLQ